MNPWTPFVAMTCFYLFAWLPSSIAKKKVYGTKWLLSNRSLKNPAEELHLLRGPHGNVERAYRNLKDYFPAYVATYLALGIAEKFTDTTTILAWLYLVGRLGHFLFYSLGMPKERFIFWFLALIANLTLIFNII